MKTTDEKATPPKETATIVLNGQKPFKQPVCFRLCPLGIQFYSPKPLPEFEILELTVHVPGKAGEPAEDTTCAGVVVHCRPEKDEKTFRVWVTFLDLPESKRKRLQCAAESSDLLCPYCENF